MSKKLSSVEKEKEKLWETCLKHALVNLSDFGKRYLTTQESVKNACLFCGLHIDLTSKLPKKPNKVAKLLTSMVEIGQRGTLILPTLTPPSEPLVPTVAMGGEKQTNSMQ